MLGHTLRSTSFSQAQAGGLRRGRAAGVVRAAATPPMRSIPTSSQNGAAPPTPSTSGREQPLAEPTPAGRRVTLWDAMKFNGPAPEIINGRLAMLGLLHAVQAEVATGETVLQQAAHPSWGLLALMALVVYGSMQPIFVGAREEDFFFFSVRAERTNARAAMLGALAVLALEYRSGVCFF